jgi:hypothetical protein
MSVAVIAALFMPLTIILDVGIQPITRDLWSRTFSKFTQIMQQRRESHAAGWVEKGGVHEVRSLSLSGQDDNKLLAAFLFGKLAGNQIVIGLSSR